MPTSVLLSIRPQYAAAILDGTKKYEFRRTRFRNPDANRVVLYASSPVCRVVGEFEVDYILALEPDKLWTATADGAGIDREAFEDYFRDLDRGFALKVKHPRRYGDPLRLDVHFGLARPPQSFQYISA